MTSKNKFIKGINQAMADMIDKVSYDQPISEYDKKALELTPKYVTIDYMNLLSDPPSNSSDITRKELMYLSKITSNLTERQLELIKMVDEDPNNLFMPILKIHGLKFPKDKFKEFYKSTLEPVIVQLKYKFLRARPYQLAEKMSISIKVTETDSHHTPAYPSGHTMYAAFAASMLSTMYPDYTSDFYRIANLAGEARMLQGVHYPSDNDASMVVASAIYEDIKYDMFPDMKIGEDNATTD
ncbi:phosphatase PAP2 family protein [Ulvibacter sp.]|nr:phosphatase PAP2 family protein [Ulvibacter sp.]